MSGYVVGETDSKTGDIAINLTLLYRLSDSEDEFIDMFSTLIIHEQIHRELDGILKRNGISKRHRFENLYTGEEVVVRLLMNQDFNTRERKEYARIQKNNNKKSKRNSSVVRKRKKGSRL